MVRQFTLSADINNCPFCDKDSMLCKNENKCAFKQEKIEDNISPDGYVRKERWYEKYYKDSRPKKS